MFPGKLKVGKTFTDNNEKIFMWEGQSWLDTSTGITHTTKELEYLRELTLQERAGTPNA